MNFLESKYLVMLFAAPFVALCLVWAARRRRFRLKTFAAHAESLGMVGRYSLARVVASVVLLSAGFCFLVLGLAGPRWDYDWQEVKQHGLDIMVVADVSESMLATDVKPTRLERAKREIYDLIGELKGDRVGIIAFAGVSFVQCPLTIDYGAAKSFLSYLRPDLIPVQGSALDEALELALKALTESGEAERGEKIIVLITDGEDHSDQALAIADKLKEAGIKVYAVGLGDPAGAPVPDLENGGFKQDDNNNIVLSKLNESLLKSIASKTGGEYRRSEAAGFSLEQNLFADLGVDHGVKKESQRLKRWHERYQWFLGLAILCLIGEMFLREYLPLRRERLATK